VGIGKPFAVPRHTAFGNPCRCDILSRQFRWRKKNRYSHHCSILCSSIGPFLSTPDFFGDQHRNDTETNAGASETCDTIAITSREGDHAGKTAGETDQSV
jgi:hypothetical protein